MRKLPKKKLPKERARRLPIHLVVLIDKFDQAAQAQGWEADQGSDTHRIARIKREYLETKESLIKYLMRKIP